MKERTKRKRYRMRICPGCREWFMPGPRNAWRQRYCSKHYVRLTIIDLKVAHRKCHPSEKDGG